MKILHIVMADGSTLMKPNEPMPTLERLQEIVGGDIEYVQVLFKGKRTYMVVNEMGGVKMKDKPMLPINRNATEIYYAATSAGGRDWMGPPFIRGDVVILEDYDIK